MSNAARTMVIPDALGDADGFAAHPPKWLVLGINNHCNLHCRMCDVGLGDDDTVFWSMLIGRHPQNMPPERYQRILDEAAALDPPPSIGLVYTEPLIHPLICDYVAAAKARGLTTSVTTNALTLRRHAAALVAAGLDQLVVSADGPPAIHNEIRGHQRSFERLYAGIQMVRAEQARLGVDTPRLLFSYTVTDLNIGQLGAFLEAVRPLAPDTVFVSHLVFITEAMADAHNAVSPAELHVVQSSLGEQQPAAFDIDRLWSDQVSAKALVAGWGEAPSLVFTPDFEQPAAIATYYRDELTFVGGRDCRAPWHTLMIRADGRVMPGQGRCFDLTLGQIDDEPLSAIWNGDRARWLRRTLAEAGGTLPACARCTGVVGRPRSAGD